MIDFIAIIRGMSQKYTVDKEGKRQIKVAITLEIKDGFEEVPNLSEFLNQPMNFKVEPIQPGLQ